MEEKHFKFDMTIYLAKYLTPVLERKWVVLACFVFALMVSGSIGFLVQPQYLSTASVLVEQPRTMIYAARGPEGGVAPPQAREGYIYSEAEKIRSSLFAAEVLKTLPADARNDLRHSADLSAMVKSRIKQLLGRGSEIDRHVFHGPQLVSEMTRRMNVVVRPRTSIVEISALSLDRSAAPVIVGRYIDVWLAENLQENRREVRSQRAFVMEERNKAFRGFKNAEDALTEFRARHELPADIEVLRDGRLQLELNELRRALSEAKARFEQMEQSYLESQIRESGVVGNIKVLDPPSSVVPVVKPMIRRIFYMGALLGLALGVGLALLPDFFRPAIRHESDIMSSVGYPVLGNIPKL